MAIPDDLRTAANRALSAGVAAARGQGTALSADYENLVKPNLQAVVVRIAAIAKDLLDGNIENDQARDQINTQFDNVPPVIMAAAELAALAVQTIVNAVLNALKAAVNTVTTHAIGIALF